VTETENHLAYLSIGSNLEDRHSNCLKGIHLLGETDPIHILERSPFYMTKPVDYSDQDWFINGVVKIKTTLDPLPLLQVLQEIEKKIGRKSDGIRFGPRILDMDIIFYDDSVMNHAELVIQSLFSNIDDRDQEVIHYR